VTQYLGNVARIDSNKLLREMYNNTVSKLESNLIDITLLGRYSHFRLYQ